MDWSVLQLHKMINSLSVARDGPAKVEILFSLVNGRNVYFSTLSLSTFLLLLPSRKSATDWKLLFLDRWPRRIPALVKRQIGFLGLTGNGLPSRSMRRRRTFQSPSSVILKHFHESERIREGYIFGRDLFDQFSALSERYIVTHYWLFKILGIKE